MVQIIMAIIISFLPMIICFFAFKKQVNILHLLFAILLGLIIVLPISFIQYLLPMNFFASVNPLLLLIFKSLIFYGLLEESFKLIALLPFAEKKDVEPKKIFLLALMVGLAVGSFEAIIYFIDKFQLASLRKGSLMFMPIIYRMFSAYIIHIACASLSGLFLYTVAQKKTKISLFLLAILLHGLYDFFVAFNNGLKWFSIGVILLAIIECRVKYTSLVPKND